MSLTVDKLKQVLQYDPNTGVFTWLVSPRYGIEVNQEAGYINGRGYIDIQIQGMAYKAHRLAWLYEHGVWPINIDHINHNKTDNRISNLRSVLHSENMRNKNAYKNNDSGVSGVSWNRLEGKWKVRISVGDKRICVGTFKDKFEAICARKSAEQVYGYHENHGAI